MLTNLIEKLVRGGRGREGGRGPDSYESITQPFLGDGGRGREVVKIKRNNERQRERGDQEEKVERNC